MLFFLAGCADIAKSIITMGYQPKKDVSRADSLYLQQKKERELSEAEAKTRDQEEAEAKARDQRREIENKRKREIFKKNVTNVGDATALVRQALRDPYSAHFGEVWVMIRNDDGIRYFCGFVNAKNSFGAYVGQTMFVVDELGVKFANTESIEGFYVYNVCQR